MCRSVSVRCGHNADNHTASSTAQRQPRYSLHAFGLLPFFVTARLISRNNTGTDIQFKAPTRMRLYACEGRSYGLQRLCHRCTPSCCWLPSDL